MTNHASGPFEVRLIPQAAEAHVGDPAIGRMALDKTFSGDLQASGKGQMLALRTGTEGSAGYVAIEVVTGTLGGRAGSFALQHSGSMKRGAATLVLGVIPDSGTGGLAGLEGTMAISIVDGKHRYAFDYSFGDSATHPDP
jgi:hypothetical protein